MDPITRFLIEQNEESSSLIQVILFIEKMLKPVEQTLSVLGKLEYEIPENTKGFSSSLATQTRVALQNAWYNVLWMISSIKKSLQNPNEKKIVFITKLIPEIKKNSKIILQLNQAVASGVKIKNVVALKKLIPYMEKITNDMYEWYRKNNEIIENMDKEELHSVMTAEDQVYIIKEVTRNYPKHFKNLQIILKKEIQSKYPSLQSLYPEIVKMSNVSSLLGSLTLKSKNTEGTSYVFEARDFQGYLPVGNSNVKMSYSPDLTVSVAYRNKPISMIIHTNIILEEVDENHDVVEINASTKFSLKG